MPGARSVLMLGAGADKGPGRLVHQGRERVCLVCLCPRCACLPDLADWIGLPQQACLPQIFRVERRLVFAKRLPVGHLRLREARGDWNGDWPAA